MTSSLFPDPWVVESTSEHRRTIIMLHGRGSNGPDFAQDLFESQLSSGVNLRTLLPDYKWIFPTCPPRYAAAFQEDITQWYEIYSLTNPEAEKGSQIEGIQAALEYISILITREAQDSPSGDVLLGGISQGFSIALLATLVDSTSLRALIGFSSWLPQYSLVRDVTSKAGEPHEMRSRVSRELQLISGSSRGSSTSFDSLPVFLAHCSDDNVIDISLGRQIRDILTMLGHQVTWLETTEGGHWINEPEGTDGLASFLSKEHLLTD